MAKDQVMRKVDPPIQFDLPKGTMGKDQVNGKADSPPQFVFSNTSKYWSSDETSCNDREERRAALVDTWPWQNYYKKSENDFSQLEYSTEKRQLSVNMLPEKMYKEVQEDMEDWENYMRCKEYYVCKKSTTVDAADEIPSIRNINCASILKFPFRKYHRFNCTKMEIRSHEESWTEDANENESESRIKQAAVEKARGNAAYKAEDYIKACEHYSNCIALAQIKEAYNNRAQANIKLKNFTSALPDLNEVLKSDPENIKALYRRAVCRRELRMYNEAITDLKIILKIEPNNKEAKRVLNHINSNMSELTGKTYRIRENFGDRNTLKVYEIQLPAYAHDENEYVIEVNMNGCGKSCVCGFCVSEDRAGRGRSTSLRIKEPDRWKRLTTALLDEMRVPSSLPTVVSKDLKEITNIERSARAVQLLNGYENECLLIRKRLKKGRTDTKRVSNKLVADSTFLAEKDTKLISFNGEKISHDLYQSSRKR